MNSPSFLGFPPPLLGMRSQRLQVLYDDGELLALTKPANVLVQADSWYPRLPVLIEAIRYQANAGKPEFKKNGISESGLWAISDLDPEFHGPVLFARSRQIAADLKNDIGSGLITFTYTFLTGKHASENTLQSDLPLARHRSEKRMLVSHTTGKKAVTEFSKIQDAKRFSAWQAVVSYPRRHQMLVHPFECGIPVLGDTRYAGNRPIMLSEIKRNYQKKRDVDEQPLYPGPACYLKQIQLAGRITIDCPQPPKWLGLLKQLEKH